MKSPEQESAGGCTDSASACRLVERARAQGYICGLRVGKFGGSETPGLAELGVTEDVYMAVVREENEGHG